MIKGSCYCPSKALLRLKMLKVVDIRETDSSGLSLWRLWPTNRGRSRQPRRDHRRAASWTSGRPGCH